VLYIAW